MGEGGCEAPLVSVREAEGAAPAPSRGPSERAQLWDCCVPHAGARIVETLVPGEHPAHEQGGRFSCETHKPSHLRCMWPRQRVNGVDRSPGRNQGKNCESEGIVSSERRTCLWEDGGGKGAFHYRGLGVGPLAARADDGV